MEHTFIALSKKRSPSDSEEFLNVHYFPYFDHLAEKSSCGYTYETYSDSQLNLNFRSTVIKSLAHWKNFKYYVSGPSPVGTPSGVRGIGSPCPKCGLFNGWVRPEVDFDSEKCAILESTCSDHGRYTSLLTRSGDVFINLETTFRNVVKEILTVNQLEVLTTMIKGQDWKEGIRNVDSVLETLSIDKNKIPLRFLVPVVKLTNGTKLSKSAIQKFSNDFADVDPTMLDMALFRQQTEKYPEVLLNLSNRILSESIVSITPQEIKSRL